MELSTNDKELTSEDEAIVKSSILDDFKTALINAQLTFVILLALSLLYIYQITIVPYKIPNNKYDSRIPDDIDKLVLIILFNLIYF